MSPDAVTPVERIGEVWVKREDAVRVPIAARGPAPAGGKLRQVWSLQDIPGAVGCGGRRSNTAAALAAAGAARGYPVRFHTSAGPDTPELRAAAAWGAEIVRHRPGYMSVIKARAREDAAARGWTLAPDAPAARAAIAVQTANLIGLDFRRVVLAVGSGLTLAGVVLGLRALGLLTPVFAVPVGGRLVLPDEEFPGWDAGHPIRYGDPGVRYETAVAASLGPLPLSPIYEAKVAPFLEPGDLLWNLGMLGEL